MVIVTSAVRADAFTVYDKPAVVLICVFGKLSVAALKAIKGELPTTVADPVKVTSSRLKVPPLASASQA